MVAQDRFGLFVMAVAILACLIEPAAADPAGDLDWIVAARAGEDLGARDQKLPLRLDETSSELEMLMLSALRLYQIVLSTQDRPGCMFYPSCSEYAKQVIARHGILAGLLMAADRLQRCNGVNRELYPFDPTRGKLLDPPPERFGRKKKE